MSYNVPDIRFGPNGVTRAYINWDEDDWGRTADTWMDVEDPEFCLMQYTGLKDKNGTEIYEGDVVRHSTSWLYTEEDEKHMADVEVITVEIPDIYYRIEFSGYDFDRGGEVIGNIHENPELLEQPSES